MTICTNFFSCLGTVIFGSFVSKIKNSFLLLLCVRDFCCMMLGYTWKVTSSPSNSLCATLLYIYYITSASSKNSKIWALGDLHWVQEVPALRFKCKSCVLCLHLTSECGNTCLVKVQCPRLLKQEGRLGGKPIIWREVLARCQRNLHTQSLILYRIWFLREWER